MNEPSDLKRFQELVEASATRELTDAETAFIGRMGFQSQECRQWLEADAETVTAALAEDPLRNVPAPSALDWARLETGLRRAGALPDPKSGVRKSWPMLPAAAALVLCIGVVFAILRDGLSDAPVHSFEMVVEILDLPEDDGSLIFDEGDDDDGVLMIVISNG
ncbi:MAG: hypothetical protein VX404_07175 [Planctomycetota bacterium]|nr:hypothetical protein [Planctomycetota bacterium]